MEESNISNRIINYSDSSVVDSNILDDLSIHIPSKSSVKTSVVKANEYV